MAGRAFVADVAELADALASGASGGNPVEVRVLSSAVVHATPTERAPLDTVFPCAVLQLREIGFNGIKLNSSLVFKQRATAIYLVFPCERFHVETRLEGTSGVVAAIIGPCQLPRP